MRKRFATILCTFAVAAATTGCGDSAKSVEAKSAPNSNSNRLKTASVGVPMKTTGTPSPSTPKAKIMPPGSLGQ